MKKKNGKSLINEIHAAFSEINKTKPPPHYSCDICGEKDTDVQISIHGSHYLCEKCLKWFEMLPGIVFSSFSRFITGNVL